MRLSGIRKDSGAIFREKNEVNERERVKQRENELKNRLSGIRKDSGAIFREKNKVNERERERVKQREN